MGYQRPGGGTLHSSLAAIFGDAPVEVSSSPPHVARPVRASAEVLEPTANLQFGWQDKLYQTDGMSTLYVDQLVAMPNPEVQGATATAIHRSREAIGPHMRNAYWMNDRWDPIYRFANTDIDLRFAAGHIEPLTNATPQNLPFGSRMLSQPIQMQAWRVPRFQTTPYTIVPVPTPGGV